jgi:predicted amidohydrolase
MSNADDSLRRPAKGPRIGLAQVSPALGDGAANLERHRAAVAKAVADGCDLLVFPELALAGYRLKDSVPDVAILRGSDTWKELELLSSDIAIVAGFVEESPDHLFYNSAAYFEGGSCKAVHRKCYLPTYGMFDEQRYFARGRSIAAFDTRAGRVAMLICEDMLHPSAVTIAACDGATLLVVPSASPARGVTSPGEADANARTWESYIQVMARSFGVWVAYCNRVGVEDGVTFWGGSQIVSPAGEVVVRCAYYDEDQQSAVLSDDAVRRRRIANPLVRDEDLDLTINELARIRGRVVESEKAPAPPLRERRGDADSPPRRGDGESPPKRFDRKPRPFGAPQAFDDSRQEGDFGSKPFRPRGSFEQRGARMPREDRFSKGGDDRPPRRNFGRDRAEGEGAERPRFDGPPRGRFGAPPRDRSDGPPRDRFAPRFGGAKEGRDDAPRGRTGVGGPGRFSPPRGRFTARDRDEGGFKPKPRFGEGGGPRERQRPDPARKPFPRGVKPGGRGRKDR